MDNKSLGIGMENIMDDTSGIGESMFPKTTGTTTGSLNMGDLTGQSGFDVTGAASKSVKSDGLFGSSAGLGSTMQGIGAIAGAAAGVYDAYNKKKYQDQLFGMEQNRVNRETTRQDKQQAAYDKVFG